MKNNTKDIFFFNIFSIFIKKIDYKIFIFDLRNKLINYSSIDKSL